jgi:hypothetical protein
MRVHVVSQEHGNKKAQRRRIRVYTARTIDWTTSCQSNRRCSGSSRSALLSTSSPLAHGTGVADMNTNWTLVVEALKALTWPIVTAVAIYIFRRPLVELVGEVARRARKVSVFEVSVELATLPELRAPWSIGDIDPRRLSSAQIFDSASQTLFQELLKPAGADYAIVDLRSGDAWLTSRLFVFALILGEVTGLRAFVFLERAPSTRRRFLGVATATNVRRVLGMRYPWLEEAFARALRAQYPEVPKPETLGVSTFSNQTTPFNATEQWRITNFVRQFVQELQRTTDPPKVESESYLQIDTEPKTWERTHWIDGERLERDLVGALEYAWVEESPDFPRNLLSEAIIRRDASFVALVDSDRRFLGLVDRNALLSQTSMTRNNAETDH